MGAPTPCLPPPRLESTGTSPRAEPHGSPGHPVPFWPRSPALRVTSGRGDTCRLLPAVTCRDTPRPLHDAMPPGRADADAAQPGGGGLPWAHTVPPANPKLLPREQHCRCGRRAFGRSSLHGPDSGQQRGPGWAAGQAPGTGGPAADGGPQSAGTPATAGRATQALRRHRVRPAEWDAGLGSGPAFPPGT